VEVALNRKAQEDMSLEEEKVLQILHIVGKRRLEMDIEQKVKIQVGVAVVMVVE